MIDLDAGHVRFKYRVAGVCVQQDHILLHCWDPYDFWALPGGRPELLESSRDALAREMEEEIGIRVEVGRLLWALENFFEHEGQHFHELGFYYQMALPKGSGLEDLQTDFAGMDGEIPITFRWFPTNALEGLRLYPAFLRTALTDLPASPVHLIYTDPVE